MVAGASIVFCLLKIFVVEGVQDGGVFAFGFESPDEAARGEDACISFNGAWEDRKFSDGFVGGAREVAGVDVGFDVGVDLLELTHSEEIVGVWDFLAADPTRQFGGVEVDQGGEKWRILAEDEQFFDEWFAEDGVADGSGVDRFSAGKCDALVSPDAEAASCVFEDVVVGVDEAGAFSADFNREDAAFDSGFDAAQETAFVFEGVQVSDAADVCDGVSIQDGDVEVGEEFGGVAVEGGAERDEGLDVSVKLASDGAQA